MRSGNLISPSRDLEEEESHPPDRRWWQYKRTWLIGVPTLVVIGAAGLFLWGSLQSRPTGFAPVDPDALVTPVETAVIPREEAADSASEDTAALAEDVLTRFTLDARSTEDWVLFDFVEGSVVDSDFSAPDWDVAFRRTGLLTNSGVTNPNGPGGALDLGEIRLEEASPPASGVFVVDSLGGEEGDEPENLAASGWYSYSFITHIVSANPNTYLFRTGENRDALVQFDSYYCDDEESGCITFRYRLIPRLGEEGA